MARILVPAETFFAKEIGNVPIYGAIGAYIQKLLDYDLVPQFVFPTMSKKAIDEIYNHSDGVYYMGGTDFDPKHYKQEKHKKTENKDQLRDRIELDILQQTLKDKKPFLGICRGAQALGIASGGTLAQHVPDIVGHGRHSLSSGLYHDFDTQKKHPVIIDKSSGIYEILKKDKIMVNSGHHQAVDTVGGDLRIVGKSNDGINEIIEHTDPNYFCFAVQAHPEAEKHGDLEPLFAEFENAVKVYGENISK